MTGQEMIALGLQAIECFNDPARRDEYFELLYDDDIVLHGYAPGALVGKPVVREFYAAIMAAFPDAAVLTDDMFVAGDKLAWRFRFRGTHLGPFNGAPPTGKSFEVPGITILRFGETRCVERWSVTDFLSMLIQIGLVPPPPG